MRGVLCSVLRMLMAAGATLAIVGLIWIVQADAAWRSASPCLPRPADPGDTLVPVGVGMAGLALVVYLGVEAFWTEGN